ncbi:MAG: Rab family GTPase [Candidatus Thorarchaeota archaeon]
MKPRSPRMMTYKTVLIGDGAVGKTSIRRAYMGEDFMSSHLATIGVDFAQKQIQTDDATVRFIIWDLAGQPSFERVRRHYYQGSHSLILVYSVIDRETFDNASKWLVEAYKYMGQLPPTAVIGNKIDLRWEHPREDVVSTKEGQQFTEYFIEKLNVNAIFKETSALTGENIQDMFAELIKMMAEDDAKARQPVS